MTTPYFWAVVGMNFGAARIGAERPDGTMQWSQMGPNAPWPDWIPEIADARLTVASYDEPSDGYPAGGLGYLRPESPVTQVQTRYAALLETEGWDVQLYHQQTSNGAMPPRDIRICTILAERGPRSFWVALYEGEEAQSRIVWHEGGSGLSKPVGASEGAC